MWTLKRLYCYNWSCKMLCEDPVRCCLPGFVFSGGRSCSRPCIAVGDAVSDPLVNFTAIPSACALADFDGCRKTTCSDSAVDFRSAKARAGLHLRKAFKS